MGWIGSGPHRSYRRFSVFTIQRLVAACMHEQEHILAVGLKVFSKLRTFRSHWHHITMHVPSEIKRFRLWPHLLYTEFGSHFLHIRFTDRIKNCHLHSLNLIHLYYFVIRMASFFVKRIVCKEKNIFLIKLVLMNKLLFQRNRKYLVQTQGNVLMFCCFALVLELWTRW